MIDQPCWWHCDTDMASSPRLRQLPPVSLLLPWLMLSGCETADGPTPLECPATGAVLLPDRPAIDPDDGAGCKDPESWTAEVDPANPTWTVEVEPSFNFSDLALRPLEDGVALAMNGEVRAFDGEGRSLWKRTFSNNTVSWWNWQTTEDGRMVITDTPSGGGPQYRVFDPAGIEIWLRLLNGQAFATPGLALAGEDVLVSLGGIDPETLEPEFRIQRWGITGQLLQELVIPTEFFGSPLIALDGQNRLAVWSEHVEIYDSAGELLGVAEWGDSYASMLVGADDGFFLVGTIGDTGFVRRHAGDGELVWAEAFDGVGESWNRINAAAALPGGGVVIVGFEDNIVKTWPDSVVDDVRQPFVLALDADGNPTWGERYATAGEAQAVTVGFAGEVYVAGHAQASEPDPDYGYAPDYLWLRRYDP